MCNSNTQQFIDQVVSDKVNNNVMFTLFDVTLEVQALEKAAGLPISRHRNIHDDVAGSANSEALSNGWNRTTRPMGGSLVALVYFNPAVHDVTTYTPLPRKDAPAVPKNTNPALDGVNPAALAFAGSAPATSPASATTSSPSVTTPPMTPVPPDHKAVDRWNRLRLTCDVMRAAGFQPGDMVYATVNGGKLQLSKSNNTPFIAKYIVDCHCNLRITPKTLKAAGLSATAYKMTATTDSVAVEP